MNHPTILWRTKTVAGFFLSAIGLVSFGCARTLTVPSVDLTPPDVTLFVFGLGDTIELRPGGENVSRSAPTDAEIAMIAVAEDRDGGVKNVQIDGESRIRCKQGDIGAAVFVRYLAQNPEDPGVGIGDEVKDRRATNLVIKVSDLDVYCPDGFSFLSASGSFAASGENFHGSTRTTPAFSFSHP